MVLAVGALLIVAACAPPGAAEQKPVGQVTTAPAVSPTPSPSPSPPASLQITAAPFHPGELGLGYTAVAAIAAGGAPPYGWDVSDGALPTGLAMSPDGNVTGSPASLGTFLFTIRVTDSIGGTATLSSSISIGKRLVISGAPCTQRSPCSVEAGCVTVCGAFAYFTNGIGPFKFGVVSGSLPTGMGLSALALTGAFPNPPAGTTGRDWVFTVRVTDAIGATAQTTAQFHVFPHIAFSGKGPWSCTGSGTASGCIITPALGYALGTPGLTTVAVLLTSTPAGWPQGAGFTAQNGSLALVCGAAKGGPFTGTVQIFLQDKSTCGANKYCTSAPVSIAITRLTC